MAEIYPVSLTEHVDLSQLRTVAPNKMISSDPHGGLRNTRTYTRISRQTSDITRQIAATIMTIPAWCLSSIVSKGGDWPGGTLMAIAARRPDRGLWAGSIREGMV
jgi:hypothetical protein